MQPHASPASPLVQCPPHHSLVAKTFVDERICEALLVVDTTTGKRYSMKIGGTYVECVWLRGALHHIRDAEVEMAGNPITGVTHVGFDALKGSFTFLNDDLCVLWFSSPIQRIVSLTEFSVR